MVHFTTFLKTFFITLLVFIALELGFWGYMKLFNQDLAAQVAGLIYKYQTIEVQPVETGENNEVSNQIQSLSEQISLLQNQLNTISSSIQNLDIGKENTDTDKTKLPTSNGQTTVKLYYFNHEQDEKLSSEQQLNINSILPIERTISSSTNVIKDTINLLLKGELTEIEKSGGFQTSFPHKDFYLKNITLDSDGTLTLEFPEVAGFTSGGSAQQLLLKVSIEKTVRQFSEVKQVKFIPDTLFQP